MTELIENVEKFIEADSNNSKDEVKEEYAYLEKGGFSSENFKIKIQGLPKFYGIVELKKLMNETLGLNVSKIKRLKQSSKWSFACFQNEEERSKAIVALNGYFWKGKRLTAEKANPAPDPLVRKRKQDEINQDVIDKKKKDMENKDQEERLRDVTTPCWRIPYDEQLLTKQKVIIDLLKKYENEIWLKNPARRSEIEAKRKLFNGLTFELMGIKSSPVTEGYRNKCEFNIGYDEFKELTVGFRLGKYNKGNICVVPIRTMCHVSEPMKKAVMLFQNYIRQSKLPPYSAVDYTGHWRGLMLRHSSTSDDIMMIIQFHPQSLTEEQLGEVKKDLIEYFSKEDAVACGIKSLYYEHVKKRLPGEEPSKPIHLMGPTHIVDSILGLQFRVSPEAFFQVNTKAANILYQQAIDLSEVKSDETVVDICCGTGTIGLCFAKYCNKVFGLDSVAEAIKDAKANAELNGIKNCEFFAGKAEQILSTVLERTSKDVVAIVDPPRAGLHMRAVTQLRNTRNVKRLVYISCNPDTAMKNFVDLSRQRSKTLRGAPFVPVRGVLVDMFPHTRHVELAVLFKREEEPESSNVASEINSQESKELKEDFYSFVY
ncbi:tRNA (uracil-5-)-methyltransferase homolog A [Amyelois transitella]|uniref:tRNA (uracil-5-)-methyltransferase homolog A n=1 Tax=Amyelois transitella TaxID=680683 RepID=UPI0029906833|nr:tRNA (uracil-5-)-methyltransferase homolog A [Amyelois transitella]